MDTADDNLEDLVSCALSPEREQELLNAQRECVFSWTNKKGEAVGVIVSYFADLASSYVSLNKKNSNSVANLALNPASLNRSNCRFNMNLGEKVIGL